ncbi:MAG: HAD family phosphatase, partial [Verrucomicrobiaceae bacterium]
MIIDCDGTLVDSMPAHFEAWCEALALHGAGGIFKEDVFFAMGGRPTRDIVVELNDEYNLRLDPEKVAFAKREAFLKRISTVTLID